ncbi:MAG TPA: hypothetical protein VNM90_19130 [Haliangium sp.]|nr:hypothetical protein [Haliangium sp.]
MRSIRWFAATAGALLLWLASGALGASLVSTAHAQSEDKGALGVGIILGEPTGIAAKLYLADDTALAGAAGFAFVEGGLHLHADFLWHPWVLDDTDAFVLPAYVGVGGRLLDEDRGGGNDVFHLGARVVGGMLFDFKEVPIDAFVEIAGVLDYAFSDDDGGIGVGLNAGIGARYYF